MTAQYKFSYRGINYLTASQEMTEDRLFLLNILRHIGSDCINLSCLQEIFNSTASQNKKLIYTALKNGWLINYDDADTSNNPVEDLPLSEHLCQLSSKGSALLVDANGLIINSAGFSDINSDYLAASATELIRANERARKRNPELTNDNPWKVGIQWGKHVAMIQRIYLGSLHFSLVIGGKHQLDNSAYFHLIENLAKRYLHD